MKEYIEKAKEMLGYEFEMEVSHISKYQLWNPEGRNRKDVMVVMKEQSVELEDLDFYMHVSVDENGAFNVYMRNWYDDSGYHCSVLLIRRHYFDEEERELLREMSLLQTRKVEEYVTKLICEER